jgi:hypothetical protein
MLYARETNATFETFEARCPHCREWIVFNRRDDLGGADAIDFAEVKCLNASCRQPFAINGDTADPGFAQILFSSFPLMEQKRYGEAVIAICRSYEMFFAHGLVEMTVWQPFVAEKCEPELDMVNGLAKEVARVTTREPFVRMRDAFVSLALKWPITDIEVGGGHVASLAQHLAPVDRSRLTSCPNRELAVMLTSLLDSEINVVRNAVAHKTAVRPSASKAKELFNEARDLIWGLGDALSLRFPAV